MRETTLNKYYAVLPVSIRNLDQLSQSDSESHQYGAKLEVNAVLTTEREICALCSEKKPEG